MSISIMFKIICYLLPVLFWNFAFAFNFDVNFPIVYTDPYKNSSVSNSYFGYSVLLYKGDSNNTSWIQIGAPKGADRYLENKTTGVIFRCNTKACKQLELNSPTYRSYPDEAFFGFNMDISNDGNSYATCGPRWINLYSKSHTYLMQGACFVGDTKSESLKFEAPFKDTAQQAIRINTRDEAINILNKAHAQIGFSLQFSKTSSSLIVGLPGMTNWKGIPALFENKKKRTSADKLWSNFIYPNALKLTSTLHFDLMGICCKICRKKIHS